MCTPTGKDGEISRLSGRDLGGNVSSRGGGGCLGLLFIGFVDSLASERTGIPWVESLDTKNPGRVTSGTPAEHIFG